MEKAACFNKAQIEVLNALAVLKTDEDVYALKQAISEFFAKRADEAMERLWDAGVVAPEVIEGWGSAHFRTPYNK